MKIREITENFKVSNSSSTGVELTTPSGIKMTVPTDKMNTLQPSQTDPNKLSLNPGELDDNNQDLQNNLELPKIGTEVELPDDFTDLPAFENVDDDFSKDVIKPHRKAPVGGDPTDEFIDDVVNHDVENQTSSSPIHPELQSLRKLSGLK